MEVQSYCVYFFFPIFSFILLTSNSMVSRAILKQHALLSFSMTPNCTRPADPRNFGVIEKLTRACYFQIALETMLSPIRTACSKLDDNLLQAVQKQLVDSLLADLQPRSQGLFVVKHGVFSL